MFKFFQNYIKNMNSPPVIATVLVDRNEAGQFSGVLLAKMRNEKTSKQIAHTVRKLPKPPCLPAYYLCYYS